MSEPTVRSATKALFERYIRIIREISPVVEGYGPNETSMDHLTWMCVKSLENLDKWPEDKLSRWLGYVQGVLVVRHVISVDEEREVSQPLFHAAYSASDIPIPSTLKDC